MENNWKKNITLFLASQTISLFGSSLVQYAIMWHITLKTQSGIMMTISILCGFLPMFFVSPFAGVWADRYNRKALIILADSFIAIATLIVALLFIMGFNKTWLLFVVSSVRAIGSGIHSPAISAVLPQLVPGDKLAKVNGINSSINSIVTLFSPMISGALLTIANIEIIFFIDVFTAAIAVFILLIFLYVPTHAKALSNQGTGYFKDLNEGFKYILNHKYVMKFFTYSTVFLILVGPVAFLTPLQVTRSFGDDVWRLTAIEIIFSVGMIIGGILISIWSGFKNKVYTMVLSTFIMGLCTVALGIVPIFWLYLLFMCVIGIAMPLFNTPSTVLLQQKVEESFLGRVFGVMAMISSVMMPLGMLVYGPLADIIRIEWLLIVTGAIIFIESIFMLSDKALIDAGN